MAEADFWLWNHVSGHSHTCRGFGCESHLPHIVQTGQRWTGDTMNLTNYMTGIKVDTMFDQLWYFM